MSDWEHFHAPVAGYREQVFYHDLPADSAGWAAIGLVNPVLGLKLSVCFQKAGLSNLVEWKQMGQGAYVLGLEPGNCEVSGRSQERARGTLQYIQPGEQREFAVEIRMQEL